MRATQAILKAIAAVRAVVTADKDWRKPDRKKVLIFDARTGQPLLNYIDPAQCSLLYQWRERSNMYVLLRCLLSLKPSWFEYARQYVNAVGPSVVVTMTDNSLAFYELKPACPGVTTVAVQASWRGEQTDIFHDLATAKDGRPRSTDYVLTYNQQVGELYRRYFGGKTIAVGSLINNHFRRAPQVERGTLVFISEFRPYKAHQSVELRRKGGGQATWEDIYALEQVMIPFLAEYCANRGLTLIVCGAKNRNYAEEHDFYSRLIGDRQWKWVPRADWYSNYAATDAAEFIVFVNSTLGYESLARGKKVACMAARGNWFEDFPSGKFGWPSVLPDEGPFWTNHADVQEFRRVLDYVTLVSDADWIDTWRQFGPRLMVYDEGNSKFVSLLRKLGVPVKIDNQAVPVLKAIRT